MQSKKDMERREVMRARHNGQGTTDRYPPDFWRPGEQRSMRFFELFRHRLAQHARHVMSPKKTVT